MYEVMNRNDNTFHGEYTTKNAAIAAAKTLKYAMVYGPDDATVYAHGGRECRGCGEFCPTAELGRGGECEGCREQDRWNEEIRRENMADFDHWY